MESYARTSVVCVSLNIFSYIDKKTIQIVGDMRNFSYIYYVKDEIIRAGRTFNITRQINSLNYPACLI